jgi:hypothetical protein
MAALALVATLGLATQASARTFVVTKRSDPAPNATTPKRAAAGA